MATFEYISFFLLLATACFPGWPIEDPRRSLVFGAQALTSSPAPFPVLHALQANEMTLLAASTYVAGVAGVAGVVGIAGNCVAAFGQRNASKSD